MSLPLAWQDPAPGDAVRWSLRLLDVPAAWVVVLVILPAAFLVAWAGYARESLPGTRPRLVRGVLVGLRFASLLLLLLVLFRPVRVEHQENVKSAEVVVLIDDSASMRRTDTYAGDADVRSRLGTLTALEAASVSRLDLSRAALERRLLPRLAEQGYEARLFRFAEALTPLTQLDAVTGRGHSTHIGDALAQALAAHRGRHVTDVVVVSDGRSNGGAAPLDAASMAAAAGLPLHTVVVGDTRPEKNLVVELVEAPADVLEGDEVAISVRVHARGAEEEATHLLLEELAPEGSREPPRALDEERVELVRAGERVVLVAPPGSARHSSQERRFRVSVPPLKGETLLDDNSLELGVHVTSEKIRVLYIDGYPRYEYRFLQRMLKRSDERIEVQVWLMSATPDFLQESTRGLPSLRRVPTARRELLDNYDVVILGDVNPYAISPDPAVGEEFVRSLFEFVERGGGLCLIAGEYENPKSFANTEFAKLLPVVLDPGGSLAFDVDGGAEFRPSLADPAHPHEIVRLHPDVDLNRRLWEEPGGLAGMYWFYPVADAKPGAEVLLRHPDRAGPNGHYPLAVVGHYPQGRTMFLAIDSTWRWRFRYIDRYHEGFWRNAVRWLALGRLRSGDRRYALDSLRTSYGLDERVTFEARVLDEDYRPSEEPSQEVWVAADDDAPRSLDMTRVAGRSGLYRTTVEPERPGLLRAWIEVGGERVATAEAEILLPSRENADPSPDPQTLASLASLTGGRAVRLAALDELDAEFPGGEERREPISSKLDDAWDHWATLLVALGLLSTEWILRKRQELI